MKTFSLTHFQELANFQGGLCVSIYLPTHRTGREVLQRADQLAFKNQLKAVAEKMELRGFSHTAVTAFLGPVQQLAQHTGFWRNQSEGLAVFISSDQLSYFNLPYPVAPMEYLTFGFFLKPLLPLFMNDGNYYLLALRLHEVDLYRGNRESLEKIKAAPSWPQRLETPATADRSTGSRSYHSSNSGSHRSAFAHDQVEWQEEEKQEIFRFFRQIDQAIAPVLRQAPGPLVVMALEHHFALYQEASTYPDLYPQGILLSPARLSLAELHFRSWRLVSPYFDREHQAQAARLVQYHDTGRTSTEMQEIIAAAAAGRVEALFLADDFEAWGTYYPDKNITRLVQDKEAFAASLTNLAAVQTFLKGGKVYLEDRKALPLPYAPVNALFRYGHAV